MLSANVVPAPSFDLAIHGTDVQFSPMGLPAAMGGDLYLGGAAGAGHASIGRYQETLTPILMDINGDQVPDFVGTQGVATFTFYVANPQHLFGTITTADTSYIQGVTPAGQLLVGSQGTITAASSTLPLIFRNLAGGFVSQSTVGLVPTFQMDTTVHFTVNKPIAPALTLLAMANDLISASSTSTTSQPSGATVIQNSATDHGSTYTADSGAQRDTDLSPTMQSGGSSAHVGHDGIFTDDTDWLSIGQHKERLLA